MPAKDELAWARKRASLTWYRCDVTGARLGVFLVIKPLYVAVAVHRPTPYHREWAGLFVRWRGRTLVNTFPAIRPQGH
jgi:hypothetical protein